MISLDWLTTAFPSMGKGGRHNPLGLGHCLETVPRFASKNLVLEAEGKTMSRIVYVNGEYVPEEAGKVSIFDRGFLFADGVYEVAAVLHGRLVDYEPHVERLERSLREIRMAWPCSKAELRAMTEELVRRNRLEQGWIYLQVTRGAGDRDFKFPNQGRSTLIAFTQAKNLIDNPDAVTGVKVVTV